MRTRTGAWLVLLLLAAAALYRGWQLHWFLTDDAFIAFRFVDNRRLGFGYTWNPPPFLPVEGYTSFAWVVLLDVVWSVFGIEPPAAANSLSLVLAFASLLVTTWACVRLCERHGLRPAPLGVAAVVLVATLSHRTFSIWTSGGLETALFNLLVQSWVLVALLAREPLANRTLAAIALLAAAIELTRPEGLLAVAATVAMLAGCAALRAVPLRRAVACSAPLLLVAAHLLYRRATYGEWLPNTYHAKVVAPWPGAGYRWAAAFVVEYAYYLALPIWIYGGYAWARDAWRHLKAPARAAESAAALLMQALALAALLGQVAFHVFVAGGDHFEYRALSFLVPLLALAFVRGCLSLRMRAAPIALSLLAFSAVSAILPFAAFVRDQPRFEWPARPAAKLAPEVPWPFSIPAAQLDALEAWLTPRGIGVRHYVHRAFWISRVRRLPPREIGARACREQDHPVGAIATIGVAGWVLSGCTLIDTLGLADYVIARTPAKLGFLGHDRKPPPGYLQRLKPNIDVGRGRLQFRPRTLTDDEIRETERYYRALVRDAY